MQGYVDTVLKGAAVPGLLNENQAMLPLRVRSLTPAQFVRLEHQKGKITHNNHPDGSTGECAIMKTHTNPKKRVREDTPFPL